MSRLDEIRAQWAKGGSPTDADMAWLLAEAASARASADYWQAEVERAVKDLSSVLQESERLSHAVTVFLGRSERALARAEQAEAEVIRTRADVERRLAGLAPAAIERLRMATCDLIEADVVDTSREEEDRLIVELVCAVLGVTDA